MIFGQNVVGRLVSRSGFWALTDQALVSLGGVLTTIVLARSLPSDTFGVYVLLFGALLVLNTVHSSIIVYPLTIRGAQSTSIERPEFIGAFLGLTLLVALPLILPLGVTTVILASWHVVPWVIAALIAWHVQETARRALFAELRVRAAIPGDVVAYLGQAALLLLLLRHGNVTLNMVFQAMVVTSLAGVGLQLILVRLRFTGVGSVTKLARIALLDGRWVLPSNLLGAFVMQGMLWILVLVQNAHGVADLQSVIVVVGVANPVMFGLGNVLVPVMARASQMKSSAEVRRQFRSLVGLGGVLLVPYSLLLWLLPGRVLATVYGSSSTYRDLTTPLRILALAYLLVSTAHVANTALLGLTQLHAVFVVQVVGSVTLVAVGGLFALIWGVTGAALAIALVHFVRSIVALGALHRAVAPRERRLTPRFEAG